MLAQDRSDRYHALVSKLHGRRVLVLGDAIVDEYVTGHCGRLSPEAPVPVLHVSKIRQVLGGAANTAANIASLGGKPTLVTIFGEDEGGATLRKCAREAGVDLRAVATAAPTLRKTRIVGQQQQIVRLDYEDVRTISDLTCQQLLAIVDRALEACDIVVISDYAKGLVSPTLAQQVIHRARAAGCSVIVDPRPQNRDSYIGCDYITPNWREARGLLGLPDADPSDREVEMVARSLASLLGTNVVLTLGPGGMSFCSRDGAERFSLPTLAKEVFDVSGAGDTVVAALALALSAGGDHPTALSVANQAASVVVGKFGTATVSAEELLQDAEAPRLVPRHALGPLAATLRAKGRKIVTINGSFDLLHSGHLHILNEAKRQGDVLLVGLNSDQSVRGYKGPLRPIVPERQRAEMLLALRVVDYVHIFNEADPIAFLEEVMPDVHVNGSEYGRDCIESQTVRRAGGVIHVVERLPNLSTSGLLTAMSSVGAN
jgi:D-beta-D-heptose 7-phosphate kinase/D-beta-D-heptose 1-phosphate adenosyltransferase